VRPLTRKLTGTQFSREDTHGKAAYTGRVLRNWSKPRCNADTDGAVLTAIAEPDAEGRALLTRAAERLGLSARAWHRTLRVARTLADLDGSSAVRRLHIAEALSYRRHQPGAALAA
jgi:magnesium chelatase family protein